MRTFIALSLSIGTVRRVTEMVEKKVAELGERGAKLAWVPPAQYHLTLRFLGDIPPESVDAISLSLRRRLSDVRPMALRLSGLGRFPDSAESEAARVLWVGVHGGKPLLAVQAAIESDMQALGFPLLDGERVYHPHLTVARVPDGAALAAADWGGELSLGEDLSLEAVVYESRAQKPKSNRGGVEYHARARVPFSKLR